MGVETSSCRRGSKGSTPNLLSHSDPICGMAVVVRPSSAGLVTTQEERDLGKVAFEAEDTHDMIG